MSELLCIELKYCEKIPQQHAREVWPYGFLKRHSDRLARWRTVQISLQKELVEADIISAFFDRLQLQLTGEAAFCQKFILNYDKTNLTNDPGS